MHRNALNGSRSRFAAGRAFLLSIPLALFGCESDPFAPDLTPFRIEGRLTFDVEGCPIVVTDDESYNVSGWRDPAPFGSQVALMVRSKPGYASWCVGEIVDVLGVLSVTTNFRTSPISGAETWGPDQDAIILGRVDVAPGGSLTILPGTTVRIIPEGWLRVQGSISIEGSESDSVRIVTDPPARYMTAPLILDGSSESGLRYLSAPRVEVQDADSWIEHSSLTAVSGYVGSLTITRSTILSLQAIEMRVQVTESTVSHVGAVHGELTLVDDRLRELSLSYSHAAVRRCEFGESLGYVTFHGVSGGEFEQNTFQSSVTQIEVRHTSRPVFTQNNFVSPWTRIHGDSYQLPDCVQMTGNWWGTNVESEIRAKIADDLPVCYAPWSSGPLP